MTNININLLFSLVRHWRLGRLADTSRTNRAQPPPSHHQFQGDILSRAGGNLWSLLVSVLQLRLLALPGMDWRVIVRPEEDHRY